MSAVAILPTRLAIDLAFDRYRDLVLAGETDAALRVSLDHNVAVARAWAEWRDLFLAADRG